MHRWSVWLVVAGWCLGQAVVAQTEPRYPFPQHIDYGSDTLLPSRYSREALDDDVRAYYDVWKERYVVAAGQDGAGQPRYRIAFGDAGTAEHAVTVSEGQGYGMILVALLAGHDPQAQELFDGLWRFARAHPSSIDGRLMEWRVPGGGDSAFDGDADLAYALLLADRQWGSDGAVDYRSAALAVLAGVLASTVGAESHLPLLGDWVDPAGADYNQDTVRSSDFMLANFRAFEEATGEAEWARVVQRAQRVLLKLQRLHSPRLGLVPDFVVVRSAQDASPRPADPGFLEGADDGHYFYNACRVPLRVGLDALLHGSETSRRVVRRLSRWAEQHHAGDPLAVSAGYRLDGTPVPDSDFFSTAFVAPLGVAAMNEPRQQRWLDEVYDAVRQEHQGYYEDSLTLLSLLAMTGNFWDSTRLQPVARDFW